MLRRSLLNAAGEASPGRAPGRLGYRRFPTDRKTIVWIVVLSLLLCWPAVLNGGPLLFFDSDDYYERGRKIVTFLSSLIAFGGESPGGWQTAMTDADNDGVSVIRSLPYSLLVYISSASPAGVWGAIWLQAVACSVVLSLLFRDGRTGEVDGWPLAILVFATSVAWYASFLMPDVYAGLLIAVALILVRDAERIDARAGVLLGLVAVVGNAAHYGHPPLALGLGCLVLLVLGWQGRLRWWPAGLAIVPPALAFSLNFAASAMVFEEPSVAPKRLPILLARSIEDGPARWHLEAHCDDYDYTICSLFETFPEKASQVLFGKSGLGRKATPEQMDRIRAEEHLILRRAFLEYPLAQTRDTLSNVLSQTVRIGTDDFRWSDGTLGPGERFPDAPRRGERRTLQAVAILQGSVVILSLMAIVALGLRDGLQVGRQERALLAVALFGVLLNAAIFGGLSAPADRYQGRVIWILPALALMFLLARRRERQA